jgi:cytidine deaminase
MKKPIPQNLRVLYTAAAVARENSHSPYSGHKVGAAIKLKNGQLFTGCNIENSSYGATTCAEQIAVFKAASECGHIEITDIMVVTEASPPWPPCGICRQVIAEFATPETIIYSANTDGELITLLFKDMLPSAFTPAYLSKKKRKTKHSKRKS